jgi:hypothetical protein
MQCSGLVARMTRVLPGDPPPRDEVNAWPDHFHCNLYPTIKVNQLTVSIMKKIMGFVDNDPMGQVRSSLEGTSIGKSVFRVPPSLYIGTARPFSWGEPLRSGRAHQVFSLCSAIGNCTIFSADRILANNEIKKNALQVEALLTNRKVRGANVPCFTLHECRFRVFHRRYSRKALVRVTLGREFGNEDGLQAVGSTAQVEPMALAVLSTDEEQASRPPRLRPQNHLLLPALRFLCRPAFFLPVQR